MTWTRVGMGVKSARHHQRSTRLDPRSNAARILRNQRSRTFSARCRRDFDELNTKNPVQLPRPGRGQSVIAAGFVEESDQELVKMQARTRSQLKDSRSSSGNLGMSR